MNALVKPKADEAMVRSFPALPDTQNLEPWLAQLYEYTEGEATNAIDWYESHKRPKRVGSRWIRYAAIVLGGIAGLFPIIASLWPAQWAVTSVQSGNIHLLKSI